MRKVKFEQSEINEMTEEVMLNRFEKGYIDDDQVQRWYDNQSYCQCLVDDFIKNELQYWL